MESDHDNTAIFIHFDRCCVIECSGDGSNGTQYGACRTLAYLLSVRNCNLFCNIIGRFSSSRPGGDLYWCNSNSDDFCNHADPTRCQPKQPGVQSGLVWSIDCGYCYVCPPGTDV